MGRIILILKINDFSKECFIMLKFIKKSPIGFIFGAAAIVLIASPEAREEARKVIVKGTAAVMNFMDNVKKSTLLTTQNPPELLSAPADNVDKENLADAEH